jgi:hypothetical protein
VGGAGIQEIAEPEACVEAFRATIAQLEFKVEEKQTGTSEAGDAEISTPTGTAAYDPADSARRNRSRAFAERSNAAHGASVYDVAVLVGLSPTSRSHCRIVLTGADIVLRDDNYGRAA